VSVDIDVIADETKRHYGGGVLHGSITAKRLGAQVELVTKCALEDREFFTSPQDAGVKMSFWPSPTSTSIRNVYPTANPDDRRSALLSRAEPFAADEISSLQADAIHVNPLWRGEFAPELLPLARERAAVLSADAQGFVRRVAADGSLIHEDWSQKQQYLRYLDIFKVDQSEAMTLTGCAESRSAARRLHELGAKTVLLTHQQGLCAYDGTQWCESLFGPYPLSGRTGRGDTATAAFIVARQQQSLVDATQFSADTTARKLQYQGPYQGD